MAYTKTYSNRFKKVVVSLNHWGIARATLNVHSLTPGTRELFVGKKIQEKREEIEKAKAGLAIILVFGTILFLSVMART